MHAFVNTQNMLHLTQCKNKRRFDNKYIMARARSPMGMDQIVCLLSNGNTLVAVQNMIIHVDFCHLIIKQQLISPHEYSLRNS